MTLPQIVSRNNIQKTNKRNFPLTNDVVQPTVWYTCPAGKIAILTGTCEGASTGSAATIDLNFAGVSYAEWQFSGGGSDINFLQNLSTGMTIKFEARLEGGETMETTQNTGTNAQFKVQFTVEEFII